MLKKKQNKTMRDMGATQKKRDSYRQISFPKENTKETMKYIEIKRR